MLRIIVAVEGAPDDGGASERVIGGLACELYPRSRCLLATYLYVIGDDHGAYRRRHHARRMLEQVALVFAPIAAPVHGLLAEVEWPDLLRSSEHPEPAVAAARERLRFFSRLGGRILNFDYVQPSLGEGKAAVSCLKLIWLPVRSDPFPLPDPALSEMVREFLQEFYNVLSVQTGIPVDADALRRQQDELRVGTPLTRGLSSLVADDGGEAPGGASRPSISGSSGDCFSSHLPAPRESPSHRTFWARE